MSLPPQGRLIFLEPFTMRTIRCLTLAVPLAVLAGAAAAQATCGSFPLAEASYSCTCPANAPSGSVWGSGPYTADSNICTAARHAGVIGTQGGEVTVLREAGLAAYPGSSANGVETRTWGSYATSISFQPAVAACGVMPAGVDSLTCSCAPGAAAGSIWGSNPYTADSNLCSAARHAGVIDAAGGIVTALRIGGLGAYAASERNGVASRSWASYPASVVFDANQ